MGRRSMALAVVTFVLCSTTAHLGRRQEASPSPPGSIDWPTPRTVPFPLTLSVRPFGDGLVATGQRQSGRTTRAAAWSPLVSVGSVDTAPRWDGDPTVEAVDLVDDTLIVLGRSDADGLVWLACLGPVGLAPST